MTDLGADEMALADDVTRAIEQESPNVLRVGLDIRFEPVVELRPCVCGRTRKCHDERMVALARAGKELPPISCSCGKTIIGRRGLVVAR